MGTEGKECSITTRHCLFALILGGAAIALWMATNQKPVNAAEPDKAQEKSADSEKPKYTDDGKLIAFAPEVYREWVLIGAVITPNDLNQGDAPFPEFHHVYINPSAWQEWKKTGTYPEQTVVVKELIGVGAKKASSGNGYFEGDFTGLEHAVRDTKRFPKSAEGWGYFDFGHKYPLTKEAKVEPVMSCAQCHVKNAQDMVFSQWYPVLRAAKGKAK